MGLLVLGYPPSESAHQELLKKAEGSYAEGFYELFSYRIQTPHELEQPNQKFGWGLKPLGTKSVCSSCDRASTFMINPSA